MSVRIHQISKQTGVANKELIALLTERGFNVTSPSSSIDNISAESIIEELQAGSAGQTQEKSDAPEPASPEKTTEARTSPEAMATPETRGVSEEQAEKTESAPPPNSPRPGGLPPGVFVKSAEDIRRERQEKEESKQKMQRPAPTPVTPPAAPARPAPPPAPPAASKPPPAAPRPPAGPKPLGAPSPSAPPGFPGVRPPAPPSAGTPASEDKRDEQSAESAPSGEEISEDELRIIHVKPPIVVRDFAEQLGIKPFRLISELMEMNIFASMNQVIDENVAQDVAGKHGFLLDVKHRKAATAPGGKQKEVEVEDLDDSKFMEPRPPVVCILGHVDHGKTTLLDYIRKKDVAAGEEGGITQHIGAYQIETSEQKITFLDTPGHAAFNKMRERGAGVTDVAVLVVAADDGFMPQTDEALKHAQASAVPIIVAVNKMDTRGADLDRVKRQMQERGIPPEDLGGETIVAPISALKGEGIDYLLEMILLQAEILELKANPKRKAEGIIIESEIEVGRGPSATVIVRHGILKTGDVVVCGPVYAKVRAMFNDEGKPVKAAPPSTPVRVIGWTEAPGVGSIFKEVKNEREARRQVEETQVEARRPVETEAGTAQPQTLENLFDAIESARKKTFRVVVRCDVQGSLEAVTGLLLGIESDKVDLEILQAGVGPISRKDVLMAGTAEAAIIGFNVKMEPGVDKAAKHAGVPVYQFSIIYQLVDQVKEIMATMLDPELIESKLGAAEVRQVFPVAKSFIAGCLITEGKVARNARARVTRGGEVVVETRIATLKRFKDDVTDVRAGMECGIGLEKWSRFEEGDVIECFEVSEKRPTL